MTTEREKTLAALRLALQAEVEGKECYLEASRQSNNELAKKLLLSFADEEDDHRKIFQNIYDAIRSEKAWPETRARRGRGKALQTLEAKTCRLMGASPDEPSTAVQAVKLALDKERASYDLYLRQSREAAYDAEKRLYQSLAGEERQHQLALVDYYEYLTDPGAWFVKKERPSLDGA